jgi:hypothetical protein
LAESAATNSAAQAHITKTRDRMGMLLVLQLPVWGDT